ncbi:hypothetical protein PIB30_041137 [Stylosanthes scabra]|uniref:Uncharacterized protein n=1 Tax=Stylosanthes scabra TaxID=79078 RepID=A0ABU6SFM4_9FABA|nr:hypothetical protein [Stylosanthes scabra]
MLCATVPNPKQSYQCENQHVSQARTEEARLRAGFVHPPLTFVFFVPREDSRQEMWWLGHYRQHATKPLSSETAAFHRHRPHSFRESANHGAATPSQICRSEVNLCVITFPFATAPSSAPLSTPVTASLTFSDLCKVAATKTTVDVGSPSPTASDSRSGGSPSPTSNEYKSGGSGGGRCTTTVVLRSSHP